MGGTTSTDTYYPVVAVNAVIFDAATRVLLTQRADNGLWCLPGGIVVFGETVEHALVRELDEEIGARLTDFQLTGIYSSNNITVEPTAKRCSIILAFNCHISGPVGTSEEVRAVKYFNLDNLPANMVTNHDHRIRDAVRGDSVPVVK